MSDILQQPDTWSLQLLQQIAAYLRQHTYPTYVVGGSIRNLLLKTSTTDWDLTTSGNVHHLARQLANHLSASYAHLHEKASRVVIKHDHQELIVDIAPLQGASIEEDLHSRDFTINAMAHRLDTLVDALNGTASLELIDPLHGLADIQARHLRAVNDAIFQQDPLRLLRAIRFLMRYHLTLDTHTEELLTRDASLLQQAAPARIHEELYMILQPAGATQRLRFLDAHGLLTVLMPEFIPARGMPQPPLHYWDVLEHSLESVGMLEYLGTTLQQTPDEIRKSPLEIGEDGDLLVIRDLLQEAQQQHLFTFSAFSTPILKLAALLHDIGKPPTYSVDEEGIHFYGHPQAGVPLAEQIMQRLSASTHDRRLVLQVVSNHMRPGQLSHDTVTERAIRRYFLELGPNGILVALISLADHLAMRGPQPLTQHWQRHLATVRLLLNRYIRERSRIMPPRLLQADELMRRLDLQPGPIIGQLLESIAEAQAEGQVRSRDEALWWAEEQLRKSRE